MMMLVWWTLPVILEVQAEGGASLGQGLLGYSETLYKEKNKAKQERRLG